MAYLVIYGLLEEAAVLRQRAYEFLRVADSLYGEGSYDLAAFCLEQHCQLLLKHKLLVKTGSYPRTHSLTRLLKDLEAVSPDVGQLLADSSSILFLTKLEDAYIGARYLPRKYLGPEVAELLKYVKEVFDGVVDRV